MSSATPWYPSLRVWLELPPPPRVPVPIARRLSAIFLGPSRMRSLACFFLPAAKRWYGKEVSEIAPMPDARRKFRRFIYGRLYYRAPATAGFPVPEAASTANVPGAVREGGRVKSHGGPEHGVMRRC